MQLLLLFNDGFTVSGPVREFRGSQTRWQQGGESFARRHFDFIAALLSSKYCSIRLERLSNG